ncbi:MAG: sugar phosphate isomerase/epimerase family protein [Victivallaceae bacterium]|nr:TIM barrel protein [Victivallaceae bacterium]
MRTISVQLYSLRDETAKSLEHVLDELSGMGFRAVEPAGFMGRTPSEFKKLCSDRGLAIPSSHSPWAQLDGTLSKSMEEAHELGLDRMVCGYGAQDFESVDAIKATADKVNAMVEKVGREGFTLFMHNHYWEFERLDGRLKYDIFLDMVPGVKLELDTYWSSNFGAENAAAMVERFSERIVLAHIKDGSFVRNAANLPLGEGKMDIKAVVGALPESARTLVIEFDTCAGNIFDAVRCSREYLVSNGLGM